MGDCFSSGGWSGSVKRVFVSAPDETRKSVQSGGNSNKSFATNKSHSVTNKSSSGSGKVNHESSTSTSTRTKFTEVKNGPPGVGLKVVVELREDCGEPRPQGGLIYFFSKIAAEEADCFADQQRMAASFGRLEA